MRFRRFTRQVHRWLGLLIGIQVLLWVTGGVIMSVLKLEEVRGEHLATNHPAPPLEAGRVRVSPAELLTRFTDPAPTSITLASLLERPVYRLTGGGRTWLVDADTGAVLSPVPEATARALAQADYAGTAPIAGLDWVEQPESEFRGRAPPLWRVRLDDALNTAIYVAPDSGLVVARRNDLWRIFDFVWMLHIMDYEEREDFNHPLLVTTAITALLFVFSGLVMLVFSFRPRAR